MNPGPIFCHKRPKLFLVEIRHQVVADDDTVAEVKTWTTGPSPKRAVRAWRTANKDAVVTGTKILAGEGKPVGNIPQYMPINQSKPPRRPHAQPAA